MLGWSINLFRVRGIQLALHFSFVLWLAYAAWKGYQEGGLEGMFWGSAVLLTFFTCVVLHELGHSLTAMHFGVGVRRILLMPIGGMAEFDSIPREPRREFLITIAGPAVNFAIVALLWFFVNFPEGWDIGAGPTSFSDLARYLLIWNLAMGIFNLIPVFPMDGGRILRASLATRIPYLRATYWAANVGKVLAAIGVAAGFWLHAYLLVALFAFIFFAGEAEYRSLLRRENRARSLSIVGQYYAPQPAPSGEPPLLGK